MQNNYGHSFTPMLKNSTLRDLMQKSNGHSFNNPMFEE